MKIRPKSALFIRKVFSVLTFGSVVLMPAVAVATVGSYGLSVWIYQMIAGPPGPPSNQ